MICSILSKYVGRVIVLRNLCDITMKPSRELILCGTVRVVAPLRDRGLER
jgi:hypothetical protein